MQAKRLLKLADWLDEQSTKPDAPKFNLSFFGRRRANIDNTEANQCGTVACALGGAAVAGIFKHQGLRAEWTGFDAKSLKVFVNDANEGRYTGLSVSMPLFDISIEDSYFLFFPGVNYQGKQTNGKRGQRNVAKMIRKFVEHGGRF